MKQQQASTPDIADKNGIILAIGDKVVRSSKGMEGTIRHLGVLTSAGSQDAVWSEWALPWDGQILSKVNGGTLMWTSAKDVEKL